MHHW